MKMGYLQNIQSFETSVETGNMQSYEKQSILAAVKVTLQLQPGWYYNDSDFILIN